MGLPMEDDIHPDASKQAQQIVSLSQNKRN